MSTPEEAPVNPDDVTADAVQDDTTLDEPIPTEPPDTEPDPVPETPTGDTLTWEPRAWYSITYACLTAGCPNQNIVRSAPMFYSNDGQTKNVRVVDAADGACGKDCKILTATKLDPQPVEE